MDTFPYIVVSTAATDDIWLADGTHVGQKLGGAGIYAYGGLQMLSQNAVLVTGVGADFPQTHGNWLTDNYCATEGLFTADPHTPTTKIQYHPDGERVETPQFGQEHYHKMEATPQHILPFMKHAKGIYIFREIPEGYWSPILEAKKSSGCALLWELNADVAQADHMEAVRAIASQCDILSLNLTEAKAMLSLENKDQLVDALHQWNVPMIYLRMGKDGGLILRKGHATHAPSVPNAHVVDPTGAGNSSTAAVLYGYCEGHSDLECGLLGSLVAAETIAQYGPPNDLMHKRDHLLHRMEQLAAQYTKPTP